MLKTMIICALVLLSFDARALDPGHKEYGDYNFDGVVDHREFVMTNGRGQIWEYYLSGPQEVIHEPITLDLANPIFSKTD